MEEFAESSGRRPYRWAPLSPKISSCTAKRPETKATRVEKTIAQLLEGKSLNYRYERPKSA